MSPFLIRAGCLLALVAAWGCSSGGASDRGGGQGASDGTGAGDGVGGSSSGTGGTLLGGGTGTGGTLVGGGAGSGDGGSAGTDDGGTGCNGQLTGIIRDFKTAYPDMEVHAHDPTKSYVDDRGIVKPDLGADHKPVYAGDPTMGTPSTTGQANFDRWYRDTDGVNQSQKLTLMFTDPDGDGVFTYDDQTFFPIDGQLFGNESDAHNFHFTFELHTTFAYGGGEKFSFIGDDDVFVYVNGHLAVNLGGVHSAEPGAIDLDAQATMLGITKGQSYPLDFFFAERHVTQSHFRAETSLQFVDCGIIIPR